MSTTLDRNVAVTYASGGAIGSIFEIQQGAIDRGHRQLLEEAPHVEGGSPSDVERQAALTLALRLNSAACSLRARCVIAA